MDSTGVYCRPTCKNVRFFDRCEAAEQAGFRPCKRCCPDQRRFARKTRTQWPGPAG
ncbi:Ada metal-binding domain-containing protein [Gloeobacter violaceus]|uniref:Ada metal-binding domain-containing protein n=1 Tax=Gloeobacter violaceus TaxID=33072 RepID=UPI0018D32C8E